MFVVYCFHLTLSLILGDCHVVKETRLFVTSAFKYKNQYGAGSVMVIEL